MGAPRAAALRSSSLKIKRAATDQEVHKAKSRLQKKRAVAKVLNIDARCWSYKSKEGAFKQQWDKFLPPTAK
jgi:hypothetical protein